MLQNVPGNVQTPPNPAIERAGKVWDRRLGDLVIRNANLRKLCFVLAFVIFGAYRRNCLHRLSIGDHSIRRRSG